MPQLKRVIFCLALVLPLSVFAQITDKVGTAGFQFLKIGVGARESALAGASTALAEGPTAIYWNVAGIANDAHTSVMFFYNPWIATIDHGFIAIKTPLKNDTFVGIAVNFISMGDMEETTIEEPQGTGRRFSAGDFAISASIARRITDRFTAGISAKYINEHIWDMVADGWAVDIGLLYRFDKVQLGMSFNDFGLNKTISGRQLELDQQIHPEWNTDTVLLSRVPHDMRMPMSFRFGASYDVYSRGDSKVLAMGNVAYFNDIGETENVGMEYSFRDSYMLRAGYKFNHDSFNISFGGGVKFDLGSTTLGVDYAAVGMQDFGYRHQTSVILTF